MLTIEELFQRLSWGELSNLALSNEGDGTIVESKRGKLITYANEGLLQLYSRFVLSEKTVYLRMIEGVTSYYLLKRFSLCAHAGESDYPDPLYIDDRLSPFQEDVIKPLEVRNSYGEKLPLNDADEPNSVFTPNPRLIQVPTVISGGTIAVLYQARHRKLEQGVLSQEIWVPEVLEAALSAFIASKVFSHMNSQEHTAKGQEYLGKFEKLCNETAEADLVNTSISTTNTNFERRGFV